MQNQIGGIHGRQKQKSSHKRHSSSSVQLNKMYIPSAACVHCPRDAPRREMVDPVDLAEWSTDSDSHANRRRAITRRASFLRHDESPILVIARAGITFNENNAREGNTIDDETRWRRFERDPRSRRARFCAVVPI